MTENENDDDDHDHGDHHDHGGGGDVDDAQVGSEPTSFRVRTQMTEND